MPRAARPKTPQAPPPIPDGPDPHMHAGKCTVCKHPQRAEIERAFVDWSSPSEITRMFGLASRATIYRHARARGLFELRRRNLHYGLGRIAEQVADLKPSAANVIAAFIAMAKINARGEWDPGHRFDARQAADRAAWEEDWAAARENELEDTLEGKPADIQVAQRNLRQSFARYKAQLAVREAEASKEAERRAEVEKQPKQNEAVPAEKPKADRKEEPRQEPQPLQKSRPATAAPPNLPTSPAQEKKKPEPEEERPYPIPRPPANAPLPEDRGPFNVAGFSQTRGKIFLARRRGRRPVVP
jgi:hypothetical protein